MEFWVSRVRMRRLCKGVDFIRWWPCITQVLIRWLINISSKIHTSLCLLVSLLSNFMRDRCLHGCQSPPIKDRRPWCPLRNSSSLHNNNNNRQQLQLGSNISSSKTNNNGQLESPRGRWYLLECMEHLLKCRTLLAICSHQDHTLLQDSMATPKLPLNNHLFLLMLEDYHKINSSQHQLLLLLLLFRRYQQHQQSFHQW